MPKVSRLGWAVPFVLATLLSTSAHAATPATSAEIDDCDAGFIAFAGADAYSFSPRHSGDLGSVRLYTLLSYQGAAAGGDLGRAFWRLEIRGPLAGSGPGALVRTARGTARIDASGS